MKEIKVIFHINPTEWEKEQRNRMLKHGTASIWTTHGHSAEAEEKIELLKKEVESYQLSSGSSVLSAVKQLVKHDLTMVWLTRQADVKLSTDREWVEFTWRGDTFPAIIVTAMEELFAADRTLPADAEELVNVEFVRFIPREEEKQ